MAKILWLALIGSFMAYLSACNSSAFQYYQGAGVRCVGADANNDPLQVDESADPTDFTKIADLTTPSATITAFFQNLSNTGTFTYLGADVYFYDGASSMQIQVHNSLSTAPTPTTSATFGTSIGCLRNYDQLSALKHQPTWNQVFLTGLNLSGATLTPTASTIGYAVAQNNTISAISSAVAAPAPIPTKITDIYNSTNFNVFNLYCYQCTTPATVQTFYFKTSWTNANNDKIESQTYIQWNVTPPAVAPTTPPPSKTAPPINATPPPSTAAPGTGPVVAPKKS